MSLLYKEDMEEVASIEIEFFSREISYGKIIYAHWSDEVWIIVSRMWCKLCDKDQFVPWFFGDKEVIEPKIRINNGDVLTILDKKVEWKE